MDLNSLFSPKTGMVPFFYPHAKFGAKWTLVPPQIGLRIFRKYQKYGKIVYLNLFWPVLFGISSQPNLECAFITAEIERTPRFLHKFKSRVAVVRSRNIPGPPKVAHCPPLRNDFRRFSQSCGFEEIIGNFDAAKRIEGVTSMWTHFRFILYFHRIHVVRGCSNEDKWFCEFTRSVCCPKQSRGTPFLDSIMRVCGLTM